jgi:hypothetical protein
MSAGSNSHLRWVAEHGLERTAYSVDGALALLTKWRRAQSGDADPSRTTRANSRSDAVLRENARLKEKLDAQAAYIAILETELAAFAESGARRQKIDAATRGRIEKVVSYWSRGATDGERCAAVTRLLGIARRLGWTLHDLLRECGIESPADWTVPATG